MTLTLSGGAAVNFVVLFGEARKPLPSAVTNVNGSTATTAWLTASTTCRSTVSSMSMRSSAAPLPAWNENVPSDAAVAW